VNVLAGDNIGRCEKKQFIRKRGLILNGYEIERFESPDLTPLQFLFVGSDEQRNLQKKG
jgi:hypothetical protein